MALEPGASITLNRTVEGRHTATEVGSGDVPVLATPQVLAWCEEATVAAAAGGLGEGETSVGVRVRLDHLRPTPVGAEVAVTCTLTQIEGRRLSFDVSVNDGTGEVATGQIVRVVVDRDRFLAPLDLGTA